ncbi:MAG: hypothetical protein FJ276_27400 [Planctomycetes bacterium]|nr:hypothetical protein [Planctomycetota bacterium]
MDHAATTVWDGRPADLPWATAQPILQYLEHRTQAAGSDNLDGSGDVGATGRDAAGGGAVEKSTAWRRPQDM